MADKYVLPLVYRWEDELLPALQSISHQLFEIKVLLGGLNQDRGGIGCALCHSKATTLWDRDLSTRVPLCEKHFEATLGAEKPNYA